MKRQATGTAVIVLLLLSILLIFRADAAEQPPTWSTPRPTQDHDFNETLGNANYDANTAVSLGVDVGSYTSHSYECPDEDWFRFRVSVSATTRKGISCSEVSPLSGYSWVDVSENIGISGDDTGQWVDLFDAQHNPFNILYYGITYSRIWVCSNGFVSLANTTVPAPCSVLPNSSAQNAIIAPFWTKLRPSLGGFSIKKGAVSWAGESYLRDCFIVTWENIADAYGHRQTFQLLIEKRASGEDPFHTKIFFQYKNITKNGVAPLVAGVQDRLGENGHSLNLAEVSNGKCVGLSPLGALGEGSRLIGLSLTMTKSDSSAKIVPQSDNMAGWNVQLNDTLNPQGAAWGKVIETGAKEMLTIAKITPVIGPLFLIFDCLGIAASFSSTSSKGPIVIAGYDDPEASVQVVCFNGTAKQGYINCQPFDAMLHDIILWKFHDVNQPQNHTLTVTATACYWDWDHMQGYSVSTSVVLSMYTDYHYVNIRSILQGGPEPEISGVNVWIAGQRYSTPVSSVIVPDGACPIIADTSPIYENGQKYVWDTWTDYIKNATRTAPIHSDVNVNASYVPVHNLTVSVPYPGWGTAAPIGTTQWISGQIASVTAFPASGYVLSSWWLDGNLYGLGVTNPVNVAMTSSHNLTVLFAPNGGGEEGCPDLLVWNGSQYQCYGIINIHDPTGEDVVKEVPLSEQDVGIASFKAKLLLIEGWIGLNFSESAIDQVKLYATDIGGNRYLCPLINATHSGGGNVLLRLLFNDELKVQTCLHETVDLTFLVPYPAWLVQGYTFVIEGCNWHKW